jgi:hypothetical protein
MPSRFRLDHQRALSPSDVPAAEAVLSIGDLIQIKGRSGRGRYPVKVEGTLPLDDARELRKLAEWYRAFAEVGNSAARCDRLKLARYLELRANEVQKRSTDWSVERGLTTRANWYGKVTSPSRKDADGIGRRAPCRRAPSDRGDKQPL